MTDVCKNPALETAWEALHKASCILTAIYQPMLENGEQASLGVTLKIARDLVNGVLDTLPTVPASD